MRVVEITDRNPMLINRLLNVWERIGCEKRYGKDGFMMLIPAPQDLVTGEPNKSAIANIKIEKFD